MIAGGHHVVPCNLGDEWHLYAVGDIHLGSSACALGRFHADVQQIVKDPKALWIGMGDYAEYIGYKDKRFDPATVVEELSVKELGQIGHALQARVISELWPIRKKCIGLLRGNHEDKYEVINSCQHLHAETCTRLGVRYLGYSCFLDLVFVDKTNSKKSNTFRLAAHHGAGAAATTGGKLNRLIKFMHAFPLADLFIMGHIHEPLQHPRPIITANAACTDLVEIVQLGVASGSYLKTYSLGEATYGEKKGYVPVALGATRINIDTGTRKLKAV